MILFYTKTLPDGNNVKVFIADVQQDGTAICTTEKALLDNNALSELKAKAVVKVAALSETANVPILLVESGDSLSSMDVIMTKLNQVADSLDSKAVLEIVNTFTLNVGKILATQLNFPVSTTSKWVTAVFRQYVWERFGVIRSSIGINTADYAPQFIEITTKVINRLNQSLVISLPQEVLTNNDTIMQHSCSDELYVHVPTMEELNNFSSLDLIPSATELYSPYTDQTCATVHYKDVCKSQTALSVVCGNKKNNTFELYDNEKRYYGVLKQWVDLNRLKAFGEQSGEGQIQFIDNVSKRYLELLIARFYMLNWAHSYLVPDGFSDDEGEDDNSDSTSPDNESMYKYSIDKTAIREDDGASIHTDASGRYNAVTVLNSVLEDLSARFGYKVYLDALIQMARWGSRKPTELVFADYDSAFDLARGHLVSSLGDLSEYEPELVNGKEEVLYGLISESEFSDSSAGIHNPFYTGILTSKVLKNAAGNLISIFNYYHFIDVITMLHSGELDVDGLCIAADGVAASDMDFKELEIFTADYLINNYVSMTKSGEQLNSPFFVNESLCRFLAHTKNSSEIPVSYLFVTNMEKSRSTLMQEITDLHINTREDLLDSANLIKFKSAANMLNLEIMRAILPACSYVSENGSDANSCDLSKILAVWEEATKLFKGLPDLSVSRSKSVVNFNNSQNNMSVIGAFGASVRKGSEAVATNIMLPAGAEQSVQQSAEKQQEQVVAKPVTSVEKPKGNTCWFKQPERNTKAHRIIDSNTGKEYGYCTVEGMQVNGKNIGIYVVIEDESNYTISDKPVELNMVISFVLQSIYHETVGSTNLRTYFESSSALCKFRDRIFGR